MNHLRNAEVQAVLHRLTHDVRIVLVDELVALYVYGSLLTPDFDSSRSDVDVCAIVKHDLGDAHVDLLRVMHARLVQDFPAWRDRVEVDYVSAAAIRDSRTTARSMIRISPGEPIHLVEANAHYVLNWYMARRGETLHGPPPLDVIPAISQAEFLDVVARHARAWPEWALEMHHAGGQAYAVLSLCRALYAMQFGEQATKKAAARFAETELPEWSELIVWAARARYDPDFRASARFEDVIRFVRDVSDRVARHAKARGLRG
ncbi:aminoglycoside adenylyltransferase domain-containing protein [Deinococcus yavapaiensis]|uniref:aminoglycoside adenylyltransferase domain-containing protein n=1 Tax=Deinococcus yavapaiensis TaxID=309889 RepID=UPI001FE8B710|nr:aminoglycoside adenylyltransferase domain-containing protein [Deinococcus yavapaiensis]